MSFHVERSTNELLDEIAEEIRRDRAGKRARPTKRVQKQTVAQWLADYDREESLMAYEHKENSGSLFRNQRKEKDSHADYNGSAKIDGVEYWVNAWINEKGDKKFLGMKFKPKDEQSKGQEQEKGGDFDDDIPF